MVTRFSLALEYCPKTQGREIPVLRNHYTQNFIILKNQLFTTPCNLQKNRNKKQLNIICE